MIGGLCRHCQKSIINRPRKLCWGCYYTPGVKEQYPMDQKHGRRGPGQTGGTHPPKRPTRFPPGSLAKIRVLAKRVLRGEQLFHPKDQPNYEGCNEHIQAEYRGTGRRKPVGGEDSELGTTLFEQVFGKALVEAPTSEEGDD